MTVTDSEVRRLIAENRILNLNLRNFDEAEAQSAAAGIALKRVFKNHGIKHAISFHRSIRAADRFREQQDALNRLRDIGPRTINLHISSKKTAGERGELLREFEFAETTAFHKIVRAITALSIQDERILDPPAS